MNIKIYPETGPQHKKKRSWSLREGSSTVNHGILRGVTLAEARNFALKQKALNPGTMELSRNH